MTLSALTSSRNCLKAKRACCTESVIVLHSKSDLVAVVWQCLGV